MTNRPKRRLMKLFHSRICSNIHPNEMRAILSAIFPNIHPYKLGGPFELSATFFYNRRYSCLIPWSKVMYYFYLINANGYHFWYSTVPAMSYTSQSKWDYLDLMMKCCDSGGPLKYSTIISFMHLSVGSVTCIRSIYWASTWTCYTGTS